MAKKQNEAVAAIFVIKNQKGLHARAAAKFVKCVERFDADVTVTKQENSVSGASIMGLMMLAAANGTEISVTATGQQAKAVMVALKKLIDGHFDEGG